MTYSKTEILVCVGGGGGDITRTPEPEHGSMQWQSPRVPLQMCTWYPSKHPGSPVWSPTSPIASILNSVRFWLAWTVQRRARKGAAPARCTGLWLFFSKLFLSDSHLERNNEVTPSLASVTLTSQHICSYLEVCLRFTTESFPLLALGLTSSSHHSKERFVCRPSNTFGCPGPTRVLLCQERLSVSWRWHSHLTSAHPHASTLLGTAFWLACALTRVQH